MRVINSKISSQMSKKINEIRSDLNLQILDAINSAIQEKVLPSIENALKPVKTASNAKWDLQSDGPQSSSVNQPDQQYDLKSGGLHKSKKAQMSKYIDLRSDGLHLDRFGLDDQECDPRSDRPHQSENTQSNLQTRENRSKLSFKGSNRANHLRESTIDSIESDDGYDMVTGANLTPHMVPEFLTGRPMQSRKNIPQQYDDNDYMLDTTLPAQQMPMRTTEAITEPPVDPINGLADVIMGMNSKPSAQTPRVRPVSTTTLTFDGKSEKFELFEDLFHTMIKMQPDMTEAMKNNHFHSLLRKNALQTFRNISSANRQTLEVVLAVFCRKYVKPELQATAKHKWHKLVFDPNTMKLPDFLEDLNHGAEKAFGEHAQAMIDSLLYAKLPPKLKRSINMARLENATYEEIVTHLERELELNGLEEGDDIPVPTMSTAPTATRPGTGLLSYGIDPNVTCNYCKKPGHVKDDCRKLKQKEEQRRNDGQDNKKEYPKCPTCDKTNYPAERCWKGAGAHLKPKTLKLDNSKNEEATTSHDDSTKKPTTYP